jgi:hypothetical protein
MDKAPSRDKMVNAPVTNDLARAAQSRGQMRD